VRVATLKIDGVETVTVSLKRAVADIRLREGNRVTIDQILRMVRNNGFTPREANVTVVGVPIERGGAPAFEISDIEEVLIVDVKKSVAAAVEQMEEARKSGAPIASEIAGTLDPQTGAPDQIAVTSFTRK
jgi:C-terminal processing protease CtpA/Prc